MNDLSKKEELSTKVVGWFKDNISTIAIVIVSLVYVLYGLVVIKETGKTVTQIAAESGISLAYGWLIKSLLNNQGIANGEKAKSFLKTKIFYSNLVDSVAPIQHYLSSFCEMQNEENLRKAQTSILRSELINYEDFIKGKIDYKKLNKEQKKAYNRAKRFKITLISETILLSDCRHFIETEKDLNVNKQTYLKKSNSSMLIMMLATALIFGYFGIDKNAGFNVEGAVWSLVQVAFYLGIGAVQYFQGYTFMTDSYKTSLIRKSNYLEKFKNMFNEDPNRFKAFKQDYVMQEEIIEENERECEEINIQKIFEE